MPNVTPNLSAGGGPAAQSLQAASAGVHSGGESAANSIGQLTQILGRLNEQIVSTFQQQAQESSQREQILVQRSAMAMEDFANRVSAGIERRNDRAADMEDFKTRTDYATSSSRREADYQRRQDELLDAKRRREDALVAKETQAVLANLPKARQQVAELQRSYDTLVEILPNVEEPAVREGLNNLLSSVYDGLQQAMVVPDELVAAAEETRASMQMQLASQTEAGVSEPIAGAGGSSPAGVAIQFSPETAAALKAWLGKENPAGNYNFLNQDDPRLAVGDLDTLVHGLRYSGINTKIKSKESRDLHQKDLLRAVSEMKVVAEEFGSGVQAFSQNLAPLGVSSVTQALKTVSVSDADQVAARTKEGSQVGSVPKAEAIYAAARQELSKQFGPEVQAQLEQYYQRQPIVDVQTMMPLAALATAIDQVINTSLGEIKKDPALMGEVVRDTALGKNRDLTDSLNAQLDRLSALTGTAASKARLYSQDAPKQLKSQQRLMSTFLKGLGNDHVLPSPEIDAEAVALAKTGDTHGGYDFDILRTMREAAEEIEASPVYLAMANILETGQPHPSVTKLLNATQPPPKPGPFGSQPAKAGAVQPYGAPVRTPQPAGPPPTQGPVPQQQGVMGPPAPGKPMNVNDTMMDAFGSNVNRQDPPYQNNTLLGRSIQ